MRWASFESFARLVGGVVVMESPEQIIKDVVPGEHNLASLLCLRGVNKSSPNYTVIKNVSWISAKSSEKYGQLDVPRDFPGTILTDVGTTENLAYYGCSLVEKTVTVTSRQLVQDFKYANDYLERYVTVAVENGGAGGPGLERHDFQHLDCPLGGREDSGVLVLAKFADDQETEMHITAFRIPPLQTIHIPAGVIHSNNYLKECRGR